MFLGFLFLIGLSVWLVPMVERARLPLLALAVICIGTLFGPAFYSVEGPLLVSIDRVLFAVLCVVAFFSLRGATAGIPRMTKSDWLVGSYVIWVLLSTKFAEPPPNSSPLGTWLFYVLLPALTYAIMRVSKLTELDLRRLEVVLLALGVYLGFTAVLESRGWYALVFPKYIANAEHWEFFGRGRGPLLNPSANGIVMTMSLAVAALRFLRAGRGGKIGYGIAVLLMLAGLYCTLTRSVWIGAGLALAIVYWQVTPRWFKVLAFSAVLLVGGLVAAGFKDQLLRMKRDKNLSAAEAEKSVQLRPLLAIVAYEMFKDAPLAGHGFGHYHTAAKPYYSIRGYGMPLETTRGYFQHNVFLSIAVQNGLVGLLMFMGLLGVWLSAAWRLAKNPNVDVMWRHMGLFVVASIGGYLVGGMFQDVTVMPMINMYLFFVAGLAVTMQQAVSQSASTAQSMPRQPSTRRSPSDRETSIDGEAFRPASC